MASDEDWVKAAKERCEAASDGPWESGTATCCPDMGWIDGPNGKVCQFDGTKRTHTLDAQDAEFIAAARTDLPRALAVIEAADRLAYRVEQLPVNGQGFKLAQALAAYRKARHG